MANRGQIAGGVLGSVLAAAAVAAPLVVQREGWVLTTYPDPAAGARLPTACAGVTQGVKPGVTYTDAQCEQMTAVAVVQHGIAIAQCLPPNLPTDTRAAFTSFAYNLGVDYLCHSNVAALARAGNLPAACAALSSHDKARVDKAAPWPCPTPQRYVAKDGRRFCLLPGLTARRKAERALCERGLKP